MRVYIHVHVYVVQVYCTEALSHSARLLAFIIHTGLCDYFSVLVNKTS